MSARPTAEFEVVVLDGLDDAWAQLTARLEGLSDVEYLWEPVGEVLDGPVAGRRIGHGRW